MPVLPFHLIGKTGALSAGLWRPEPDISRTGPGRFFRTATAYAASEPKGASNADSTAYR